MQRVPLHPLRALQRPSRALPRLPRARLRLARMLVVGGTATVLYAVLTGIAARWLAWPAPLASLLAYAVASAFSYGAHRRFTFGSHRPHGEALPRFLALNLAGYGTALLVPLLVTGALGAPVWASVLVTCTVVPAANWVGLDRLVFPSGASRPPLGRTGDGHA